ncbi:efflux RND transporter periplasmic adaptor subunit [Paragemmobacter straminiformis]|uniref:Efflux RND transporter periplasmic adaptor subunit n=1 Tax=Paragemmobacter straminiformis TaxID=2045119 RepID=A0A842I8L4_9RHOB|nr:efflux RND transporter periplasmic adaptor subunit [Gemmobacter straminiformis]MBC2835985.1 efflux RND transporter periplasmic adaptor subunit [Gemmobacter straminiformis]
MRSLLILPALISALAAPAFAAAETQPAAATVVLPAITVSTVASRPLRDRVIVSGLVGPVEEIRVAPLIEGQPIETLLADVGDQVQAGQTLATLSKSTLELQRSQFTASLASARATIAQAEAQMLEARASADEAQRVNERTAALVKQGAASQAAADQASSNAIAATARVTVATQSLEAARAQVDLVQAQLANLELSLERSEVKAPVAGTITQRNAVVGAIASGASQPMFTLIRDGALELNADVSEIDLTRLAVGQKVSMVGVGSTEPLSGTVRLVEPSIDQTTRLGRARISIDQPEQIRQGMFLDAEILVAERDAVSVPVTAVGASAEGASVMLVKDGIVSRVQVQTGIRDRGWVEILSGVQEGDTIVTKAGAFVRDGDKINPVPSDAN